MNIFKKAWQKTKDFFKGIGKQTKKITKDFVRKFKKDYKTKKSKKLFKEGALITFNYNAKDVTKKFDKAPLIVCLGWSRKFPNTHFLGLNLHWLPKEQRVYLAALIVEMLDRKKGKLVYEDVKPLIKKFEKSPILRMYIYKRVSPDVLSMNEEVYLQAASMSYEDWHIPTR